MLHGERISFRRDLSPPIVSKRRAGLLRVDGVSYEASRDLESIAIGQRACHGEKKMDTMRLRIDAKSPRNIE
jgi:hypothetical protein